MYCGRTGNGHVSKLVNNAVGGFNRMLTYEAAALGFRYGLSIEDMWNLARCMRPWPTSSSERLELWSPKDG